MFAPAPAAKTVALVAHDNMKDELLAWVARHREALAAHRLVATGTTGRLVSAQSGLEVERLKSGLPNIHHLWPAG